MDDEALPVDAREVWLCDDLLERPDFCEREDLCERLEFVDGERNPELELGLWRLLGLLGKVGESCSKKLMFVVMIAIYSIAIGAKSVQTMNDIVPMYDIWMINEAASLCLCLGLIDWLIEPGVL